MTSTRTRTGTAGTVGARTGTRTQQPASRRSSAATQPAPAAAPSRPTRRSGSSDYLGFVQGANALRLDYAEVTASRAVAPTRAASRAAAPTRTVQRPSGLRGPAREQPPSRWANVSRPQAAGGVVASTMSTLDVDAVSADSRPARLDRPHRSVLAAASQAPAPVAVPRAPFLAVVVALVVVGVLGVLMINTKINENAFRLDELREQQAALDLQEQQLTQRVDEAGSPGNLAAAAKRLGLVPAGTPAFINLSDGHVVGDPEPAAGVANATAGANPGR